MKVENDRVVYFHYILSKVGGDQLENSDSEQPMAYLHGHRNILPALEHAMRGHEAGDKFQVTLNPDEAYGERFDNAVQRVPIKHLTYRGKLRAGMIVKINIKDDRPRDAKVVKVGKFNVDVDTNHPLAGMSLSFDISIVEVREATPEELRHGHAHGDGGHQH